jgi:hypothetical protein
VAPSNIPVPIGPAADSRMNRLPNRAYTRNTTMVASVASSETIRRNCS